MDEITIWRMVDRLKIELAGRGLSLRKIDAMLPPGQKKRHRLQRNRGRSLPIEDILEILEIAEIDPATFFGQVAGYGHPLEIAALRGVRKARWSKRQARILARLADLDDRGGKGYEAARHELRSFESLRDEDPEKAEMAAWSRLEVEEQPGAVVGILSFLAVAAPQANRHCLLELAISVLGGALRSAAGARLSTAVGRCFLSAGFAAEGVSILENFALRLSALYGDNEEHALALFVLAQGAATVGDTDAMLGAISKAAAIGSPHLHFSAMQFLAYRELNVGDVRKAARYYDELVGQPQFEQETKALRLTVACSGMTAHFLAGDRSLDKALKFRRLAQEAKGVLNPREYMAIALDLALYLEAVSMAEEARRLLESEVLDVLELEDSEVRQKFAERWESLGLPKDARFRMISDCVVSSEPRKDESPFNLRERTAPRLHRGGPSPARDRRIPAGDPKESIHQP